MNRARHATAVTAVFSLLFGSLAPAFAAPPAPTGDYAACQTTNEADFRKAVLDITAASLTRGTSTIDYRAAVADEWRRLDVGRTIDAEVDKAFEAVKDEQSWGSLLESLGSENKARELTIALTERVYRSPAVQMAIENLANGVGRGIGSRIELATSDAAGPAIECMKAFLGPRYGSTVAGVVTGTAGKEFEVGTKTAGGDVTAGGVLNQTAGGITGAAILVMRRQIGNMAGRLGQRLVGSVLSRLVSVVAGGVGLVLIAKDVWDLRYGVLPIIANELKSIESKAKVQEELAASISDQIRDHVTEIAAHAADRIVEIWKEYRAAHAMVLDLAEREADFRRFLDRVRPEALPRVDEVTALLLPVEGEAGVMRRLSDGTLDLAVNKLPEPAMEIARQTRSLETALAWSAVAGVRIDKVLEFEVFQRAKPGDFTTQSLERVVSLDDAVAIKRLVTMTPTTRDVLFDLDPKVLTTAARALEEGELTTFAGYLTGLPAPTRQRLLDHVASNPTALKSLARPRVRDAVLASKNQGAALDIILRSDGAETPAALQDDVRLAWEGQVHPEILWHRHPILVVLTGLASMILLLLLRRVFRGPRSKTGGSGSNSDTGNGSAAPSPNPIES
ncbi:MAG: hypothetical protein K2Q28_04875 [Hyphomicrobium sp.]|nr:hypothetical protein [Hyphomicrobium sp.]